MWKTRQGFSTILLQANSKGCSAARQRVCFGYKMSRVQILSSLPITYLMNSNEGSLRLIKIGYTKSIFNFLIYDSIYIQDELGHKIFFVIIKRSQFSSVERGSPKPDVVGSNPTERDQILVICQVENRTEIIEQQSEFDLLQIKESRRSIKKKGDINYSKVQLITTSIL